MKNTKKSNFLIKEVPALIEKLSVNTSRNFGLMSPQHMLEHLIVTIKNTAKKYEGERESPPNKRQVGFQNFIRNGCLIEHRPSDKTEADLPPLKYDTLKEAIAVLPEAIQRFYTLWESEPDYIPYNNFMGELSFEEVEIFYYMHVRFHLWQFGLIESYP